MTIIQNIDALVAVIPAVLLYIVPGFVLLWLYSRLHDRTLPQDYLLYSIFISYLFTALTKNPLYCIVLAIVSSAIVYLLSRLTVVKKIMRFTLGFSPSKNITDDVIDYETGTYVYVKTADWIFSGIYVGFDHENKTILMSKYALYGSDGRQISDNPESVVAIPMNKVEYIDYSYPKESKVKKYWSK